MYCQSRNTRPIVCAKLWRLWEGLLVTHWESYLGSMAILGASWGCLGGLFWVGPWVCASLGWPWVSFGDAQGVPWAGRPCGGEGGLWGALGGPLGVIQAVGPQGGFADILQLEPTNISCSLLLVLCP